MSDDTSSGPPPEALNLVRALQNAIAGHPPVMAVWALSSTLVHLIATTAPEPKTAIQQLAGNLPRWLDQGPTTIKAPPEN